MTCPFISNKSTLFSKFPYINFSDRSIHIGLIRRINYDQGRGPIYSLIQKKRERGVRILRENKDRSFKNIVK